NSPGPAILPSVADRLQLGNGLEVLGTARGTFHLDQAVEAEEPAVDAECTNDEARVQPRPIRATADDLAENVEIPDVGRQGEVEAALDGRGIPSEGEARWSAPQVWVIGRQGQDETTDVVRGAAIHDVEVECRPRRAVHRGGDSLDDDELDACFGEDPEQRLEVRHQTP